MAMTGRAVHYGLAAFGEAGAAHALHILRDGMLADMGQMAIRRPAEARGRLGMPRRERVLNPVPPIPPAPG